jgi:hypothetical protein
MGKTYIVGKAPLSKFDYNPLDYRIAKHIEQGKIDFI